MAARDADASMLGLLALDPGLARCDPRRALYLDTETTGLAGGTGTVPFLVGLTFFDAKAGVFVVEQLLLRRFGEEAPILRRLSERLAEASMIVTFNGKAFDLPLLRTRFVMNRLRAPDEPPHLDLVHVARRVHPELPTRTLVALEGSVLGRGRVGDVAGGDIVSAYAHFLRTGDAHALEGVVVHNECDLLAMVALVGLYGEPVGALPPEALAAVARTARRAGELDRAVSLADEAIARGGGALALRARGEILKARGDRGAALADFEAALEEVDCARTRLELAKLYEHHARAFSRALAILAAGTTEAAPASAKREARLRRKLERSEEGPRPRRRKAKVSGASGGASGGGAGEPGKEAP